MDLVACESLADLLACVVVGSTVASPSQTNSSAWLDSVQAKLTKRFGSCLAPSSRLLPATAMQESLVVETMRDGKSYWSHRMWRLRADVDLDRLRQAWQHATKVHDILRTSFVPPAELDRQAMAWCRNEGLLAAVLLCVSDEERPPFAWSVDHLDDVLDIAARERQARQPGTLGVSPWSVNLLEGEGQERVMMVNMHHALHDAWSYDRIMQTVEDRYNNHISDAPATAFADGLAGGLLPTAEERTRAKHWWEQHFAQLRASTGGLASPPFPDLTQSRQKPAKRILRTSRAFDGLDGPFCRTILGPASPSMLFQAAFGCVVAEYLELKAVVLHALALNVFEQRQGYRLELSGDSEVLSQSQLQLMLDQVEAQVHTMLQHPNVRLDQLTNVMPTSLASISTAHELEGDEGDYPAGSALDPTAWVQHHARHHPTWTAALEIDVEEETEQGCTFAELDAASDAIIGQLAAAGISKGSVVALSMARNLASLAATVAIFKAGYVYLPIDEELPAARKDFLVRDSCAAAVLISPELAADLAPVDGMAVLRQDVSIFDTLDGPPCAQETHNLLADTSSTLQARLDVCRLAPWLCCRDWTTNGDAVELGAHHHDVGITHFGSVPSVLLQLRLAPRNVPSVRVVTTGGEKASNELLDMWAGDGDGPLLMNVYGPTECTIGCVSNAVDAHSNARNIGLPLDVVRAVILLPGDVVAKRGQPGELCIAGDLVSTGYLGRPEEQAKAFGETARLEPGRPTRIYRTGDVMRMMADGTLEFLGRKDQQAKVRGQRLELGEVVSFLQQTAHAEEYHFAAIVAEREACPMHSSLRSVRAVVTMPARIPPSLSVTRLMATRRR
ncbi:hypothetical protein L7F22_026819 [Adiantum nelumboides]|nr:hypothetical protein [Adiantum nelumboides]